MEAIEQLLNNPHGKELILYVIVGLVAFQFIVKLWDWFQQRFGIETKMTKHEKEQSESIQALKTDVGLLKDKQETFCETQKKISDTITSLNRSFIEKEVDDMRWDILEFANALMSGRKYNKEQFDHALTIYSKYQKIIKENNMTNEQVDASMEYVREKYQECMRTGFDY